MEFILKGTQIATPSPTTAIPSAAPTPAPTTAAPTTSTPTTPAPITSAPTTDAPTPAPSTPVPTTPETTSTTPSPTTSTSTSTTSEPTSDPTMDCEPMDFRLSIQLGQGSCSRNKWWTGTTKNEGTIRYSDYMQDGGDWSVWAGDSSYKNAEAVRVGIWTEDDEDSFCMTDTDIRFCIQLSDSCSNSNGNTNR